MIWFTSGKVRYIGTSTFAAYQIVESLWASEKLGLNRFVCEQPPYNLLDRRIERELLPVCQTYGIGVIPWSPLGGGMLTGKYKRDEKAPEGSRYAKGKFRNGQEVPERDVGCRGRLARSCATKKASRWMRLLWRGSRRRRPYESDYRTAMEQLEDNLKALDIRITDEDKKWTN